MKVIFQKNDIKYKHSMRFYYENNMNNVYIVQQDTSLSGSNFNSWPSGGSSGNYFF